MRLEAVTAERHFGHWLVQLCNASLAMHEVPDRSPDAVRTTPKP